MKCRPPSWRPCWQGGPFPAFFDPLHFVETTQAVSFPGRLRLARRAICYRVVVLPELTDVGELPPGVHLAGWQEFQSRFGGSSPRRVWLSGRLRALLELAATNGKLRRIFIWGSFVTAKPSPKDLDILLIMDEDFEVEGIAAPAQAVFDSVRAKLLFESDVFWARASIGSEMLDLWLDTYQTSRSFRKRGIVELELP
jgi:hypothetical protein